jgi:hypothetical protein
MALRPAPKRKSVDYQKLDDLQQEIFGSKKSEKEENKTVSVAETKGEEGIEEQKDSAAHSSSGKSETGAFLGREMVTEPAKNKAESEKTSASPDDSPKGDSTVAGAPDDNALGGAHLSDLETIAARIVSSKAGQGRNTTRPFSLPRTLIIDTTRLKSKFRTIDEQFTQNVIIDFLLREALGAVTPENYKDFRAGAFAFVKRAEETTRRSLTVTEEVIYQMSELKAGINLETGRKYSNDEIFSTLLALGVSWLYRNNILT